MATIQLRRKLTGAIAAPPAAAAGEPLFSVPGFTGGGPNSLYINNGTAAIPLVDSNRQVELAGTQTITGPKTFAAGATVTITDVPTTALHAANKAYVDTAIGGVTFNWGIGITETTPGTIDVDQATQALLGGARVSTNAEIAAGALDTTMLTPLGLRSQLGADGSTLVTTVKTVVPALNEIYSRIEQLVGVVIFAGTYDATTNIGVFNGQGGIAAATGPLPAASVANHGAYVIVTVAGTGVAPAPVEPIAVGDWLQSDGTAWMRLAFAQPMGAYLPLSGGQLTGPLNMAAGSTGVNLLAGTDLYVMGAANGANFVAPTQVNTAFGTWATQNIGFGIDDSVTPPRLRWKANGIDLGVIPSGDVGSNFVSKAGDTMTGPLTITGTVNWGLTYKHGLVLGDVTQTTTGIQLRNNDPTAPVWSISRYQDSLDFSFGVPNLWAGYGLSLHPTIMIASLPAQFNTASIITHIELKSGGDGITSLIPGPGSNDPGGRLNIRAASGDGTGAGGPIDIVAGFGSIGGTISIRGGQAGTAVKSGNVLIQGGPASGLGAAAPGGDVIIEGGAGQNVSPPGHVIIRGAGSTDPVALPGNIEFITGLNTTSGVKSDIFLRNLKTAAPTDLEAIWNNNGVLNIGAGGTGGLTDAPVDTYTYGRKDAAWLRAMPLTGGQPEAVTGGGVNVFISGGVGGSNFSGGATIVGGNFAAAEGGRVQASGAFATGVGGAVSLSGGPGSTGAGGAVSIAPGAGGPNQAGGAITLTAGASGVGGGAGGTVIIEGGDGFGGGGFARFAGGDGQGATVGGAVNIFAGSGGGSFVGTNADVAIAAGGNNTGSGGSVSIKAGDAVAAGAFGGDISISMGASAASPGSLSIINLTSVFSGTPEHVWSNGGFMMIGPTTATALIDGGVFP